MDLSNKIKAAAEYIKGKSKYNPTIGLILGSGLGAIADQIEDAEYFPYNEILLEQLTKIILLEI